MPKSQAQTCCSSWGQSSLDSAESLGRIEEPRSYIEESTNGRAPQSEAAASHPL
jgi:hypothetical protein